MIDVVQSARRSAEAAREEIVKVMQQYRHGQPEFELIDDAYLGIGWTIRRLTDLETALSAQQPPG
jgi:hypothetical protein